MEGVTGSIPVPPTSLLAQRVKAAAPKRREGGPREPPRATTRQTSKQLQYTARPPEISNTAPVENEQSSDASQATSAAISSTVTKRFIGIFDSM